MDKEMVEQNEEVNSDRVLWESWKSSKYWQMTGAISSYFQILETGTCGFITNFTKSEEVQYKTVMSEADKYPFESSPASY